MQASAARAGGGEFCPHAVQELREGKQELIIKVQALKKVSGCCLLALSVQGAARRGWLACVQYCVCAHKQKLKTAYVDASTRCACRCQCHC